MLQEGVEDLSINLTSSIEENCTPLKRYIEPNPPTPPAVNVPLSGIFADGKLR